MDVHQPPVRRRRPVWDDARVPESILEVIALTAADARAADRGGADRIELVADMAAQGLSPTPETFAQVKAATGLPVRVMVRLSDGYGASDPRALAAAARELRHAGADEFVLGFLDAHARVDLGAVEAVLAEVAGCRWTFHRAIDHAADRAAAWHALGGLPGLDQVLTSGGPGGVGEGLSTLAAEAGSAPGPLIMAGGGLRREHVAPLHAAGVRAFHTGGAVRPGGSWDQPVDAALVRGWRELIP